MLSVSKDCIIVFLYSPVITFEFEVGGYGDCSEFCGRGGGNQTRDVSCFMITSTIDGTLISNETVEDVNCTSRGLTRPQSRMECNARPCPIYAIGQLGPVCLLTNP